MRFQQFSWLFVIVFGLVSCNAQTTLPIFLSPTAPILSMTDTPTETVTPAPSVTSTATLTPQPAFFSTPVSAVENLISAKNAQDLTKLAEWGHSAANALAYTPNGKLLAIAADTGIYFYDAKTLADAGSIHTDDQVSGIAFSHDSNLLAVTFHKGAVQVWQMADHSLVKTIERETGRISGNPIFLPDDTQLISGSDDGAIRLWQVSDGKLLKAFRGRLPSNYEAKPDPFSIALSPDGTLLVTTDYEDGNIRVWNIATGALITTLPGDTAAFLSDGKVLAVMQSQVSYYPYADEKKVELRRVSDWSIVHTLDKLLDKPRNKTQKLQFSSDGKILVTSDPNQTNLWNTSDGSLIKTLHKPDQDFLWRFAFSPDSGTFAFITQSGKVEITQITDDQNSTILPGFTNIVYTVAFSPDGRFVATGNDWSIQVWRTSDGALMYSLPNTHRVLAFSPDGKMLASGSFFDGVYLWDVETGSFITKLGSKEAVFNTLAFSPNGKYLAAHIGAGVQIWDITSRQSVGTFETPRVGDILTFSADSNTLAVGVDQQVMLWNVAEKQMLRIIKNNSYSITEIKFSKDGEKLLVTGDLVSILWDIKTGEPLANLALRGETFSPDLNILTSVYEGDWNAGAPRGQVILWQFPAGKKITSLKLDAKVSDAAYSPDGKLLAFALRNGTIQIWGVK